MLRYFLHTTGLRWGFFVTAVPALILTLSSLFSDKPFIDDLFNSAEVVCGIILFVVAVYATAGAIVGWAIECLVRFIRRKPVPPASGEIDGQPRSWLRSTATIVFAVLRPYLVVATLVAVAGGAICYARARRPIICDHCKARYRTWGFSRTAREMLELRYEAFTGTPPSPIRVMVLWEEAENRKQSGAPSPILCPNCRSQELTVDPILSSMLRNGRRFAL